MSYYTKKHKHYCGIDLHAKMMYVCIINADGDILFHKNMKTDRAILYGILQNFEMIYV